MARIDRLGWAAGSSFVSHGASFGIRVNDPSVLHRLAPLLPPGWKPSKSLVVDQLYSLIVGGGQPGDKIRRFSLLYQGAARIARTMDMDEVLDALENALQFDVAVRARRRLFVHAGVVAWRGKAILVPGRSHTGKTELVAALVRAGATYYSDEYAVLDAGGRVHPYARPLSLRQGNGQRPARLTAQALGGSAGTEPLPVGLIAISHYQPGGRWRPRLLSPGQAVLALLDNTLLARAKPEVVLPTLQRAALAATTLKSKRGEAQDVAPLLLERVS